VISEIQPPEVPDFVGYVNLIKIQLIERVQSVILRNLVKIYSDSPPTTIGVLVWRSEMTNFRKSLIAAILPITMTSVPAQAQIIDIDLDLGALLGVGL
jgi:hypothetical protein